MYFASSFTGADSTAGAAATGAGAAEIAAGAAAGIAA